MAKKTAAGNISQAWKDLEDKVAFILKEAGFKNSYVLSRDREVSKPDVHVDEIPFLAIDTKYKADGWHHHTKFLTEVEPYRGMRRFGDKSKDPQRYSMCFMPTRTGKDKQIYVTTTMEDWIKLLKLAFMRDATPGWKCPRCPGALTFHEGETHLGLFRHSCARCNFELLTAERLEPEEKLNKAEKQTRRKKGEKKTVIKDLSSASAQAIVAAAPPPEKFNPLPGQRKLTDLLKKKEPKQ